MKTTTIIRHGHCFDGLASTALLTRFFVEDGRALRSLRFRGLDHQPGGSHVPEAALDGDENAVVDFRYTVSRRLRWYFDHHPTGVLGDREREALEANGKTTQFFEPSYGSCAMLVRDVLRRSYGFDSAALAPLVAAADVVDTARYASAAAALDLTSPHVALATVLEYAGDDEFVDGRVRELVSGVSFEDVVAGEPCQERLAPIAARQASVIDLIASTVETGEGIAFADVTALGDDRYPKFALYGLEPEARYTVAVSVGPARAKVAVGANPWATIDDPYDVAAICSRYGGGGHPHVGAVSLRPDQVGRAREIGREIAREMRSGTAPRVRR